MDENVFKRAVVGKTIIASYTVRGNGYIILDDKTVIMAVSDGCCKNTKNWFALYDGRVSNG